MTKDDEFDLKHVELVRMAGSLNAHIEEMQQGSSGERSELAT